MPSSPAFFFSVFDDVHLCVRLVGEIRALYPTADVIAVSDGSLLDNGRFARYCHKQDVMFVETEKRLKLPEFGALWLLRLFEQALSFTEADTLIRTEGDCRFHRKFNYFPISDVGGTLSEQIPTFPRGGCQFWQRSALKFMVRQGVFADPRYQDRFYSYQRYGKWKHEGENEDLTPVMCSDRVMGDVCQRLGLTLESWNEVNIQFRGQPKTEGFAATHPHR